MSCIAVQIIASPEPGSEPSMEARERAFLNQFPEVLPTQETTARRLAEQDGIPAHIAAVHRVHILTDVEYLLRMLKAALVERSWYQVKTHLCFNDEQRPCGKWQAEISNGSIPQEFL